MSQQGSSQKPQPKKAKGKFDSPAIVEHVTKARKPQSAEQVAKALGIEVNGPLHVRLGWLANHDGLIAMSEGVPANRRTYGKPGTKPQPLPAPKVTRKETKAPAKKAAPTSTRKTVQRKTNGGAQSRRGRSSIGPRKVTA